MRVLVIQTAFIGDVILATPLLEKLRGQFPEAEIDFLLRKGNEGLFKGHPYLRRVLIWNKQTGKYRNWLRVLFQIRGGNYDLVVNCQRFAATGLLTMLSGGKQTIGFRKNPLSVFFSRRIKHEMLGSGARMHETQRNLSLVAHLVSLDGGLRPVLYPTEFDRQGVLEYQQGNYFCLAPASVWPTKQFPANQWSALLPHLLSCGKVFLIGSRADWVTCEALRSEDGSAQVVNLSGKLSFLESAALMQGATMNFVNDSGPMHLASAVNAPVTAIYCSTIPEFGFTPLSDTFRTVESTAPLPCRPCGSHGKKSCPQGHFRCATTIETSQLIACLPGDAQKNREIPN
jgi:heptosyltransferase-2